MSNVVKFGDYNTKNYSNSKELILFFDKYKNRIKNFVDKNDLTDDVTFLRQYDNFNNIYDEIKNGKKWINDLKIEKLLNTENNILFDEKSEEEAFDETNEYNTLSSFLVLITCIDMTRGKILELDDKYLNLIVTSLTTFNDINIDKYKNILNSLMNDKIRGLIKLDEKRALADVEEVIMMLNEGRDISNIVSIFNESDSYSLPDINHKMLTIDNVHDYYINQLNLFFMDYFDDETYSVIDLIVMLNHTDLNVRNMYVNLVYDIREKKLNLVNEISYIKNLTEVFMYLFVDNDIKDISFNDVRNIVNLRFINKSSVEQTIEDLKLFKNGEMKR